MRTNKSDIVPKQLILCPKQLVSTGSGQSLKCAAKTANTLTPPTVDRQSADLSADEWPIT